MRIEFCHGCGAPLEARWNKIVIVCRHCGDQNAPGESGDPVPSSIPDDGRLRLAIDGRTYLILGQLASGDSSNVFLARWVRRLGELVVIKILRCSTDRDLLSREQAYLRRLQNSAARGTEYFANLVPEPISSGLVHLKQGERFVSVFRWRSGFTHSLSEVRQFHPQGVSPGVAVWTLKRLLEVLHWSHESGVLHGSVLPPHVLIHPRNHGAMLIGWSTAVGRAGSQPVSLPGISRAWKDWYMAGQNASTTGDVAMAARCALQMAGAASSNAAGTLPQPLADLLIRATKMEFADAWTLRELVSARALDALGPPAYCPLAMPGWPLLFTN